MLHEIFVAAIVTRSKVSSSSFVQARCIFLCSPLFPVMVTSLCSSLSHHNQHWLHYANTVTPCVRVTSIIQPPQNGGHLNNIAISQLLSFQKHSHLTVMVTSIIQPPHNYGHLNNIATSQLWCPWTAPNSFHNSKVGNKPCYCSHKTIQIISAQASRRS